LNIVTTLQNSTAIAIGGFDGMHLGHQQLFSNLGKRGTIVVIETGYANLTPKKERERYSTYPIHYIDLDEIRALSGEEFILYLKELFPSLKKIVVGYDFHFGKNRKYNFDNLKDLFDGEVVVVDEVSYQRDSIHSHKIRQKINIGDITGANQFLGYNYTIRGEHIKGQGIGAKELVATINLKTDKFLLPKEGVYATLTKIDDAEQPYPSVSFLGHRVSTDGTYAVETHILDTKVICNQKASISFVKFIRPNKKFELLEELKQAIELDIKVAREELK